MVSRKCVKCGVELSLDNWLKSCRTQGLYKCKSCIREYKYNWVENNRERVNEAARNSNYRHGVKPMSENKTCSSYLGCHVAERVLSKVFKNVEVMPPNHPGYDFICNKGKKIDVKSCCMLPAHDTHACRWLFTINRNSVADYFLCIAFDNRDGLNPLHIWLIPAINISHLQGASISVTTIDKWDEYRIDITKVIKCCNKIKGEK